MTSWPPKTWTWSELSKLFLVGLGFFVQLVLRCVEFVSTSLIITMPLATTEYIII